VALLLPAAAEPEHLPTDMVFTFPDGLRLLTEMLELPSSACYKIKLSVAFL